MVAYRLFRQTKGRTFFAEVAVGREADISAELGKAPEEWVTAAREGVATASATLGSQGSTDIKLCDVKGTWVDTTHDVVYVAAIMAVMRFLGREEQLEPVYADGKWVVRERIRPDAGQSGR